MPEVELSKEYLATLVAIFGTTISPYLFFWQASQEVEEEKERGRQRLVARRGASARELNDAFWDVNIGMLFSNLVFYFIVVASGAALRGQAVDSAEVAARALRPVAGPAAEALFAAGIIGAGALAVPVLTGSAAFAVCETFGCRSGLNRKPQEAKVFYAVIAGSTMIGAVVNFFGVSPMRALYWTAVLNGLLAPPLLVVILLIAKNPRIMKQRVNGVVLNIVGWTAALIMLAAAVALLALL